MALIPVMVRLAPRLGMVDMPDPRKVHARPIARVGGIGICVGALVAILLLVPMHQGIAAFLAGSVVLLLFGAWDDSCELGHYVKFIGQFIAVGLLVYWGDIWVSYFPFIDYQLPASIGKPFTIIAVVGVVNAINHSDGLDGLAGGESLLSLGAIAWLAYQANDLVLVGLAMAVIGGVFGFLRFNSHPAVIFMGDSGSQFLGFSLATFVILLTQQSNPSLSMAVPLLLLGLPVIDIIAVFAQRIYHKMNWFKASRNHIHHRLLDLGFDHYQSVVIIYSIHILFVVSAILFKYQADLFIVTLYLVICVAIFAVLIYLERTGWKVNVTTGGSALATTIGRLKASHLFTEGPVQLLKVGLPLYLVVGSIFVVEVPSDIAMASAIMLVVLLAGLMLPRLMLLSNFIRVVIYGSAACITYLVELNIAHASPLMAGVELAFFVVLALAIALAVRWNRDVQFATTPTDYLMVFVVVVAGMFAQNYLLEYSLALLVAKVIILFYGCEVILSHQKSGYRGMLSYSVAIALAVLAVRGI